MNVVERAVDNIDPSLSAWLRGAKARWRKDQIVRLIKESVAPGAVTVDVGANRGVYTLLLSARAGRTGRVHAIEPHPDHAPRLRTLARRHPNITFHPVALSDQPGEAELRVPIYQGRQIDALATLNASFDVPYERLIVPVRTLDDVLSHETGRITFLKCDVEGYEQYVLRGGVKSIRESMPVIVAEIEQRHRADPIQGTFTYLGELGYVGYFIDAVGCRPLAEFDVTRHQIAAAGAGIVPTSMPKDYVSDFVFLPRVSAMEVSSD